MLFIYAPNLWLSICKTLGITVVDIVKQLDISRRQFYYIVKNGTTNIDTVIKFTDIINNKSIGHKKEFELPAKTKIVNPKLFAKLWKQSNLPYVFYSEACNLTHVTTVRYIYNEEYLDYNKVKKLGDTLVKYSN